MPDVKPENILVRIDGSDDQISTYFESNPSQTYPPRIEPDLSADPIITVVSQPLPNFGLKPDASNLEICLGDFGCGKFFISLFQIGYFGDICPEALAIGQQHTVPGVQPVVLRAPEVILGHPWSTPIDIWSAGCLVRLYSTKTRST